MAEHSYRAPEPDTSIDDPHTDAVPDQEHEERWVYAGLRILDGTTVQAWITGSGCGENLYFTPRGTPVVGEIYRAHVTRDGDKVILHDQPIYLADGRVGKDDAARFLAEDEVARSHLAAARLEGDAARRNELHAALEPLKQIALELRSDADKGAFVAYILRELIPFRGGQ
jgi:hypothetical protein